jgi:hypothetical protein
MAETAAIISAIVAVGGTTASQIQASKARKAERKATKASQAAAAFENQRNIRQAVLQSRVARARAITEGQATQGGFGGSGLQGAISSTTAQTASNIGFARSVAASNNFISSQQQRANTALSRGATFQAIGNLPSQFGLPGVKDVFFQQTDKVT